jgi:hypothetical protein
LLSERLSERRQAARSETWSSNELEETAVDEKQAADERNRSNAEGRNHAFPLGEVHLSEEPPSSQQRDWLRCPQAEEVSERIWHAEKLDADWLLGWRTRIASEAL